MIQTLIIIAAVITLIITLRFIAFPTLGKRKMIIVFSVIVGLLCASMILIDVNAREISDGAIFFDILVLAASGISVIFSLVNCISPKYTELARKNSSLRPEEPQVKTCKRCGASVPPYSSQCPLCGGEEFDVYIPDRSGYDGSLPVPKSAADELPQPIQQSNGWFCGACGYHNKDTDAFCGKCGKQK